MSILIFILILTSVSMSAAAQILLKAGMKDPGTQQALSQGFIDAILATVGNGFVLSGLFLYGMGAAVWLAVLARVDVSMAYPFVAIGFVLTMCLAVLTLGETVGLLRVVGTLLIAVGAALVARS